GADQSLRLLLLAIDRYILIEGKGNQTVFAFGQGREASVTEVAYTPIFAPLEKGKDAGRQPAVFLIHDADSGERVDWMRARLIKRGPLHRRGLRQKGEHHGVA